MNRNKSSVPVVIPPALDADESELAARNEFLAEKELTGADDLEEFANADEAADEIILDETDAAPGSGWHCLCCGESNLRRLQVDHVTSWYSSGNNALDNLQTLCKGCNNLKGINEMNFRLHCNRARRCAPELLPSFSLPEATNVRDAAEWERYLRRLLNFFYGCGAVHSIAIGARGVRFYEWEVELCEGNDPQWLKPHLKGLRDRIRLRIQEGRHDDCVMERLIIKAPGAKSLASPARSRR